MKVTKTLLALAISAIIPSLAIADSEVQGPMAFDPISGSAYGQQNAADLNTTPWVIPEGYSQSIVSDESDLNIYVGTDWHDMNTVNETQKHAGRYLYRTHEVRGGAIGNDGNSLRVDGNSGGAVSVVDLQTGEAKEVVGREDWEALDGLVWTPWHTVLFAEEVIDSLRPDPEAPQAKSGLVYELKLKAGDPTAMESVAVLPKLGALSHEGLEIDDEGNVYVIDEHTSGSIYKFVPTNYGDLSDGQLYALKVDAANKQGPAQWVALDMAQAQISARVAAANVGATKFCRPEDLEKIASTLYVALTCENVDSPTATNGRSAVLAVNLGEQPSAKYVVAAGKNAPIENQSTGVTGFAKVDNLASGPDGKLWMVEDNDFSDIWVFDPASEDADNNGYQDGVHLFASLKDKPAEGTGIYFGKDPHTLFVNVQHSSTGNDKTMAITNRK
ncbi:alkaline phosphatase PhoX [Methylobacter sp.]|uniref:alkaline phosphatase PhoX n=1 Tax=Methylobacter sp. TaxID=2051955 RepID=UPI0025D3DCDC|nr:alkaline phosphatase PhoX [Methylobacter sp.]